jgi:hypothetical protein
MFSMYNETSKHAGAPATRREILRVGGLAALGLSSAGLMRLRARAREGGSSARHKRNTCIFVVDEVEGEVHDSTTSGTPLFSPDSRRLAYGATSRNQSRVIVDGKAGKAYDGIGTVCFSPDSQRVAYSAQRNDRYFVVLDGREGKPHARLGQGLFFSPDSTRLVYVAQRVIPCRD